ncbi:LamG-like jellyroll fold domain-containing protein [Rhodopirellula baltica]|uniref:Protein containing FecR protein domain n=1 Tax=Rhodopirellula baltica WH47 TaxID=991778 RepID=F2AQW7_RHOBT|nr:LamG-like jellyroll fold domain-containing protein [Rhodopirellula baltica]EGF27952.1 protein containing FecR protein domain [Rhodopirellula baltica WH47]
MSEQKREQDFDQQLSRLLDGELTEAEVDRLAKSMANDETLRRRFCDQVEMDEGLAIVVREDRTGERFSQLLEQRLDAESQKFDFLHGVLDRSSLNTARNQLQRWAPLAAVAIAACLMVAFLIGMWAGQQSGSRNAESVAKRISVPAPATDSEPVDASVALLKRTVNVEWQDDSALRMGDSVSANETLDLKSGWVQLQFFRGATLTLEGPAKLEIRDPNLVVLHEGNAWASVPVPARGFTVLTSETKIVDLGTEFGVSASIDGRTEVHVFDGLVELHDPSVRDDTASLRELVTGQSISVDGNGNAVSNEQQVAKMPSESLLQPDREEVWQQRIERWESWSTKIRSDPRVLMYYDFASPAESGSNALPTILPNLASGKENADGSIIGCAWSEGRWPGKSALDFKRPSDRVRFHLSGEYKSITLAAWVRVDGLDRLLSSLLLTDGWDEGEVHWQFDRSGQLGLSVGQVPGVAWRYTPPLVDLTTLGQWIHVASVFDGSTQTVRHYFNGGRVPCEGDLRYDGPIRIGDAELCNWGRPVDQNSHAIRNFNGRMDEFLMLSDALDEAEIMEIYHAGNPTF